MQWQKKNEHLKVCWIKFPKIEHEFYIVTIFSFMIANFVFTPDFLFCLAKDEGCFIHKW